YRRGTPDLNKYVHATPKGGGMDMVFTVNPDGKIIEASAAQAKGKNIDEVFGKDMSQKIMGAHEGEIAGKDFVMGAEGMKTFYDQMLPKMANKLVKPFGSKVEQSVINQPPISRGG